jgi:hypothetical protein
LKKSETPIAILYLNQPYYPKLQHPTYKEKYIYNTIELKLNPNPHEKQARTQLVQMNIKADIENKTYQMLVVED